MEGLGAHLFEKIEGDHFTVMGLPLLRLLALMRGLGLVRHETGAVHELRSWPHRSVGMGKSATAALFREAGVPVHDADAVCACALSGKAVPLVEAAFPGTAKDGAVDRTALGAEVMGDAQAMERLEAIVHPLVRRAETAFLARARRAGPRSSCSTSRCCSKPAATAVRRRDRGRPRRLLCKRRGFWHGRA